MVKRVGSLIAALLVVIPAQGGEGSKAEKRLTNCGVVLNEILDIPDNVPQELLDKAECVIVIPSVKKLAVGIGGSYGRGAMSCRRGKNFTGSWSAPAMYRLKGANIGVQLGGQATDFLLLVMNSKGADSLLKTKVKLGAGAAAAAGPKGRTATAATDAYMRAEVLSYSRSRGLFAGVSVEGSTLRQDPGANKRVYGRKVKAQEIVREGTVGTPPAGQLMISTLNRHSPSNRSEAGFPQIGRSQPRCAALDGIKHIMSTTDPRGGTSSWLCTRCTKMTLGDALVSVWPQTLVERKTTSELEGKFYLVTVSRAKKLRTVEFIHDPHRIVGLSRIPRPYLSGRLWPAKEGA